MDFWSCRENPSNTFTVGSLEYVLVIMQKPLVYENTPGKKSIEAIEPLPAQGSQPAADSGRALAGKRT
jgi:hypothetical protein